jgi:hypothetical protein
MREQGVGAGFELRLVGENFHFAVFQRSAVVGSHRAKGVGAAILAHFVLEEGVVARVEDRKCDQRDDGDSFDKFGEVGHGFGRVGLYRGVKRNSLPYPRSAHAMSTSAAEAPCAL